MKLLEKLCRLPALSGNEGEMTRFLIDYLQRHAGQWRVEPQVFSGERFQDCLLLVFGKPQTAIFAHLDSVGFMVRYGRATG